MQLLTGIVCATVLGAALYGLLIAPNVLHRKLRPPRGMGSLYAHRGLHDNILIPENSLPAFERAARAGVGVELDVRLTRDGEIVVFHDATLERMCGEKIAVRDATLAQLRRMRLAGTRETIPTLAEALSQIAGRVPLVIEMKEERRTCVALAAALHARMGDYHGAYCVESFHPLLLRWYRRHAPCVFRGQLAFDGKIEKGRYGGAEGFALAHLLCNVLSRPDFIAYNCKTDANISFRVVRSVFRPLLAAWTVRSQEESDEARSRYDWQIFEGFLPKPETEKE